MLDDPLHPLCLLVADHEHDGHDGDAVALVLGVVQAGVLAVAVHEVKLKGESWKKKSRAYMKFAFISKQDQSFWNNLPLLHPSLI